MSNRYGLPSPWMAGVTAEYQRSAEIFAEQQLRAELGRPVKPVPDPLVRCRVLVAFRIREHGRDARVAEVGETVLLPGTDARAMAAIGRAESVT